MAVFNELQVGRFNRCLQKLTGIKGSPPVRQLGTEILPTFQFAWGNEMRYLEGWSRFSAFFAFAAVAAAVNQIRLRNPVGSNVIAIIEYLEFSNSSGGVDTLSMSHSADLTDLNTPAALTNARWDPRGSPQSVLVCSTQQTGGAADLNIVRLNAITLANVTQQFINTENQEIPILPGEGMHVRNAVVNVGSQFTIWWRERFLEDQERF